MESVSDASRVIPTIGASLSRVCERVGERSEMRHKNFPDVAYNCTSRRSSPLTQPRRLARTGRAAEPLARSGRRARGTRVVARRARAVMGKGLDLDAWIAKVRARAGAAPPRRSPRVDAKRLARCARLFSSTRRGSAKIPKRHRERASPLASARSRVGGARQRIVTILAISRSTRVADLRAS